MACTEADFENRPCAPENCAKLVRGAFPTGPRKFVRKMCGGLLKCAEIVRNLCGVPLHKSAQNIGVGFPRMCVHKFRANFRKNLNFSLRPSSMGKKGLKAQILERGSFRIDLSTKFGKEIPSRNLREKRSCKSTYIIGVPQSEFFEWAFGTLSFHSFSLILPLSFPIQALSPLLPLFPSSHPILSPLF